MNEVVEEKKCEEAIRIWVCTWNMAAKSHFPIKTTENNLKQIDTSKINELQIVPTNYDIYVFGVQESIDDGYFDLLSEYFKKKKIKREKISSKEDRVEGRGDGSFLNSKFTGIAVYINKEKKKMIQLKKAGAVSAGMMEGSKGAVGVVLKVHGVSICFISAHMSANAAPQKREYYKTIVEKSGGKLGTPNFQLLEQFHHVIWFGDLNYRVQGVSSDEVMEYMSMGQLEKIWKKDTLKEEMALGQAFSSFREPIPRLDFYPTYKKKPDRQYDFDEDPLLIVSDKNSQITQSKDRKRRLHDVYRTKFKVPFYKGGAVEDRLPSFTDRVLYHSLLTTEGQLVPENDIGILNSQSQVYKETHNYGCISHHLKGSDHSAVYCGFTLQCPVLTHRPPSEFDEHGRPKRYVILIRKIEVIRGNRRLIPIKISCQFPAPYEVDEQKSQSVIITQQDLEQYHRTIEQIDLLSKQRIKPLNSKNRSDKNHNNIERNNFSNIHDNKKVKNLLIIESDTANDFLMQNMAKESPKKVTEKNKILESSSIQPNSISGSYANERYVEDGDSSDDMEPPDMGSFLTDIQSTKKSPRHDFKISTKNKKLSTNRTNSSKDVRGKSNNNIPRSSLNTTRVPNAAESSPQSISNDHSQHQVLTIELDDNQSDDSKRRQSAPPSQLNANLPNSHLLNVNNHEAKNNTLLETSSEKTHLQVSKSTAVGLPKKNEMNSGKKISPERKRESGTDKKTDNNDSGKKSKLEMIGDTIRKVGEDIKENSVIAANNLVNDYFSKENRTALHDIMGAAPARESSESSIERIELSPEHEYKKNRSAAEDDMYLSPTSTTKTRSPTIQKTRSRSFAEESWKEDDANALYSLYEQLRLQKQKLTLKCYGSDKRPVHGYIHMVIRIKLEDGTEPQTVFGFKWDDFGQKVSGHKDANLNLYGIPLMDSKGSITLRCRVDYQLSLEDGATTKERL